MIDLLLAASMLISEDALGWDSPGVNGPAESPYGFKDEYYEDLPSWCDKFGPLEDGPHGVLIAGPTIPKDYTKPYPIAKGANGPKEDRA